MFKQSNLVPRHRVTLVNPGFLTRMVLKTSPSLIMYGPYRDGVFYVRRLDGGHITSSYWLAKHTDTPAATPRGTVRRATLRPGTQPGNLPLTLGDRHAA